MKVKNKITNFSTNSQNYIKMITAIQRSLPRGFSEALKNVLEWRGISVEQLAERTQLTPKTLYDIKKKKVKPKFSSVIAICLGLNLPTSISYLLIESAGYRFNPELETHTAVQELLSDHYMKNLDECNGILAGYGLPSLKQIE
jgi:transcriptional regulator with XRE-family HTH domain